MIESGVSEKTAINVSVVPKKNVNGYTRLYSDHARYRMSERHISLSDVKFAVKNIETMTPLGTDDNRWKIVAKNGLNIIGIVDDNAKTFVVLTCFYPDKF